MPNTAIVFGVILIALGVGGYASGPMNAERITALIPAFFGIVLAGLGIAARAKESLRKHLMHGAVIVALLGFIATAGRLLSRVSELTATPAVISQAIMATVCFLFVVLAIRSFAAARRNS